MSEFVNTISVLGDDAVMDSIIERTITEFKDNMITEIGHYAFYGCAQLAEVNCPEVLSIKGNAFSECAGLETVNFPKAESIGEYTFKGCKGLKRLHFPLVKITSSGCFEGCQSVESVELPNLETLGAWPFRNAASTPIKVLDFHKLKTVTQKSFGLGNLSALILRRTDGLCNGASGMFDTDSTQWTCPIKTGTGYIYVPRALLDSYKAATNWSTYATQFRALEDYTVDGTITGELDETKI